jgi:hypothetical protein
LTAFAAEKPLRNFGLNTSSVFNMHYPAQNRFALLLEML